MKKQKSKELKIAIIILTILLAVSVVALTGTLIIRYVSYHKQASVEVPGNIITPAGESDSTTEADPPSTDSLSCKTNKEPDPSASSDQSDSSSVSDLTADTTYTITLQANGSVKECGGYCLIENEDKSVVFYTQTFKPGENITIMLPITETAVYTFTGIWGSIKSDVPPEQILHDIATGVENMVGIPADDTIPDSADTIELPTDRTELSDIYTVQSGDTLSVIAAKCNTTAEKLAAYNNIDDPRHIMVGQVLNIPPQDYVISETDVPNGPTLCETASPVSEPSSITDNTTAPNELVPTEENE